MIICMAMMWMPLAFNLLESKIFNIKFAEVSCILPKSFALIEQ